MTDAGEAIREWQASTVTFWCEPMKATLSERGCMMFRKKVGAITGAATNITRNELREHACYGCPRNKGAAKPKKVGVFRTNCGWKTDRKLMIARNHTGLTQIDVAEFLHIDVKLYGEYERGEKTPTRNHKGKLAKFFGMRWKELEG